MDLKEIKETVKREIKRSINENIRLITEKWSFSDVIDDNVPIVLDFIQSDLTNADMEQIDKGLFIHIRENVPYEVLGRKLTLNYFVYNCSDDTLCDFIYKNGDYINGFQEDENILNLTLYMVRNQWRSDYCEKNVSHELEHILQIEYGLSKNQNYTRLMDNAYDYASQILRKKDIHSKEEIIVAWLIYYGNSHEQDAFIQEYGQVLKKNPFYIFTKNSDTHNILKNYTNCCNYFLENIDSKRITNAINQYRFFGYNKSNFRMMATKQLNRFKKKMNNIEKNFKNNSPLRQNQTKNGKKD